MVIENIQTYIRDINQHLFPLLKSSERKRLEKVKVEITPSENECSAESDSQEKTIKFSRKLIRLIVRTSVAQLVDKTRKLNRQRFWGFYTSFYPYLYLDTEPEIAAELTKAEIDILKTLGNTHEFRWVVEQKIMFIYLHELYHQIQEYAIISKQIYEKKISEGEKSSLLFRLEEDADEFAVDKVAKMDFYPIQYRDVLDWSQNVSSSYAL